jgi:hypothetical protein
MKSKADPSYTPILAGQQVSFFSFPAYLANLMKQYSPRWTLFLLSAIFCFAVALFLRSLLFAHVPNGLNRDEAALGYNAYSLIKTGMDEYGKRWPVSITSFGDQKLPGYVYLLIPFISLLGLETWVVRLPSLIAGLFLVIEIGYLGYQVSKRLDWDEWASWGVSTVGMLFIAVAPWANHFSRVAYEAHIALVLFILGFITYLAATEKGRARAVERFLLIVTSGAWSLTFLTYHTYHIFIPLIIVGLVVIDWRKLIRTDKLGVITGALIGISAVLILLLGGVFQANQIKSQGITPFKTTTLNRQHVSFRALMPDNDALYTHLLFNKATEAITIFAQNYLSAFSANFFFVHGSNHGDHNPGHMANMHLYIAPFLFLGVLYLWEQRKRRIAQQLFAWLFLAIIPASLTIQPQHEIRISPIFPVICLIAAIGCITFIQGLKKSWLQMSFVIGIFLVITLSTFRMGLEYLYIIPVRIQTHEQFTLLAHAMIKYGADGNPVITNSESSSPYIWYLFESKYDPATFIKNVHRYAPDKEGFIHVKQIGNIYFQTIDWDVLTQRACKQKITLILPLKDLPDDRVKMADMLQEEDLITRNGATAYQVWTMDMSRVSEDTKNKICQENEELMSVKNKD